MRWPGSFNTKAQRFSTIQTVNGGAGLVTLDMLRGVIEICAVNWASNVLLWHGRVIGRLR